MVYDLVDRFDQILKQQTEKFDFDNPPFDPEELSSNLIATMIENKGSGLAAPQVGIPYAVCVAGHHSQPDEIITLFNPKIVDYSGDQFYAEEGCLTFPGLYVKVKRFEKIRLRYQSTTGVTDTTNLDGWAARVIQHEVDHLNGILYQERATRYHLDQGKKQKMKLDRMRKKNARSAAA